MSTTQQRPSAWVLIGALVLLPTALLAGDSADAVESFYDAYRSGDAAAMLAAYTEDAVFEDVNQRHRFAGAEQLRAFLGSLAHLHQEMDIVVDRQVASGDTVVVEYHYVGTLAGAALSQLLGKEGCPDLEYSLPVTSWYRVSGDKIAHQKDFIDLATLQELQAQAAAAVAETGAADGGGEGR